jgi:glycosyltransferase involved in cell wall biosynthesis
VGDGVADALRRDYAWPHVVVVRNSFPAREDDGSVVPEAPSGLVYAGRVDAHRELETVLAAAPQLPGLPVTLIGPSDEVWLGRNAAAVAATRAQILPPVPVADVTALLRETGLALVTHSDKFESHLLALPNKLFHAVHAGVPVIATDVPELASVVRRHDLGELYAPGDAAALADAVRRALARYPELVASVAASAATLSWTADAAALAGVYEALEGSRTADR